MKRREVLALIIFFGMTTAALTPTAYRLGVTHGSAFAAIAPLLRPNLYENGAAGPIAAHRLTAQDCPNLGQPGGIARPGMEIDCLPAAGAHTAPTFAAAPKLNSGAGKGNLTTALVSAIADGAAHRRAGATEGAPNALGSPIGLALAPNGKPSKAGLFPGGGVPGSLIPLGLTPQGGPVNNLPDLPVGGPPENPGGEPPANPIDDTFEDMPDVVVPLPAGFSLMLTGLLGLFAAARKK